MVGWENKLFCSCQYLENCRRYVQSYYYLWSIGSCICAFDWHRDRWPWNTLHCISWIFREFLGISQISDANTAKRMKVVQYCQRQRCEHVELEQFLSCYRVAPVCQRQLGLVLLIISASKVTPSTSQVQCSTKLRARTLVVQVCRLDRRFDKLDHWRSNTFENSLLLTRPTGTGLF